MQEALHEGLDALRVTGHQQLVQSLHGDHHVPTDDQGGGGVSSAPHGRPPPLTLKHANGVKGHAHNSLNIRSNYVLRFSFLVFTYIYYIRVLQKDQVNGSACLK